MRDTDTPAETPSTTRAAVVTLGGFVLLGLVAGWLWSVLAEPAAYTVTGNDGRMNEAEAATQFGVTVTYAWLGALAGVGWGGFCAWRYASRGWPHVLVTLIGAAVAAVLAWRTGLFLGPPDPVPIVKAAEEGARVPRQLQIDSYGVLFVWPVTALAGLLAVVTWILPPDSADDDPPDH